MRLRMFVLIYVLSEVIAKVGSEYNIFTTTKNAIGQTYGEPNDRMQFIR